MNSTKKVILISITVLVSGCAASYKPIRPDTLPFPSDTETSGVRMLYQYDILKTSRNKKYAKKEPVRGVRLVAIELTNETNRPLIFNEDIEIYAGGNKVVLIPPDLIKKELRQQGGWYMFWSLLWIIISKCENDDCSVIPLPVGAVIGVINLATASGANKDFMLELNRYNLLNKTIPPGESVYGLVGIRTLHEDQLNVRLKK